MGVTYDPEKKEQLARRHILNQQCIKSEMRMLWHKKEDAPESTCGIKAKPSCSMYIEDLE